MSENIETTNKGSPFLNFFRRKKRVNGTQSADDLKTTPVSIKTNKKPIKEFGKENKGIVSSRTVPENIDKAMKKKSQKSSKHIDKTVSLDVLHENDANVLVETLEAIGDDKPLVARSIPKHARVVKKEDTSMKNCIFEKEVYDTMLSDSLRVCEMLQCHLDDCITSIRAKSPGPSSSVDGFDSYRSISSPSSTMSSSTSPGTRRIATKETHM